MGTEDTDWVAVLQIALLLLFTIFVTIGAITTTARLIRYRRIHADVPLILWRDVIARNSLALPFIAIMVVRAMRATGSDVSDLVEGWPWVLFTSLPAVIGAAIYAYFELFIIERGDSYPDGNGHDNAARDAARDEARDAGRDPARDGFRDTARDAEHDRV
jgi:hypothetical protein